MRFFLIIATTTSLLRGNSNMFIILSSCCDENYKIKHLFFHIYVWYIADKNCQLWDILNICRLGKSWTKCCTILKITYQIICKMFTNCTVWYGNLCEQFMQFYITWIQNFNHFFQVALMNSLSPYAFGVSNIAN